MLRILLLITDLKIGGTPFVVRELAKRLTQTGGAMVEVASLSPWEPVADQLREAGITVHALEARGTGDLIRTAARLTRLIRHQKYDIVFSFLLHANAMAALASRFVEGPRWIQAIQTTQPTPRWHWWLQRLASHAAETIVTPSSSVFHAARQRSGISADKIIIIPNALDPVDWPRVMPLPVSDDPIPIGFIGRLDPVKRVSLLVRSVKELEKKLQRSVHLHIFGEGPDRGVIEREIAHLHLDQKVTLHGMVADSRLALARLAMLVLPSLAEGFPLVLIEAMASGVPIVAAKSSGIIDVIDDEETGLLTDPQSTDQLSMAMARVIQDESFRQKLIDNAIQKVEKQFSWQAILPRYQSLLGMR